MTPTARRFPVTHRRSALESLLLSAPVQGPLHRRRPRRERSGPPRVRLPRRRPPLHPGPAPSHKQTSDLELAQHALTRGIAEIHHAAPPGARGVSDLFWRFAESFELDLDALLVVEGNDSGTTEGYTWHAGPGLRPRRRSRDPGLQDPLRRSSRTPARPRSSRPSSTAGRPASSGRASRATASSSCSSATAIDVAAEFDVPELEYFETSVHGIVGAIRHAAETNDFPAIPGASCSYCTLTCDVAEHPERVPLRLLSRVSAERALGVKLAMTAALRNVDAALQRLLHWSTGRSPATAWRSRTGPPRSWSSRPRACYRVLQDGRHSAAVHRQQDRRCGPYLTTKKFSHVREPLEALAKVTPGNPLRREAHRA
jgi:hypothetical protein